MSELIPVRRPERLRPSDAAVATLRLLATTDLHGQVRAHDYIADSPRPGTGLAGLATLIAQARAEAADEGSPCVLLDNGDTLQGTPLADMAAAQPVTPQNPIVACLNALAYDAIGVGNHDLDHGLDYLQDVAGALAMPMICSNLHGIRTRSLQGSALVKRRVTLGDGEETALTVGVVSLIPALTKTWNAHILGPTAMIEAAAGCLRRMIPQLRAQGADIVVVLAHMGVGHLSGVSTREDSALALAKIPGIDALITGHTHRRLPGGDYRGRAGVDATSGKLGRTPAVMAGHGGSDLAVLDLQLSHSDRGWKVLRHRCALRQNRPETEQNREIMGLTAEAHTATQRAMSRPAAFAARPLHSYFALVAPSEAIRLVAQANARVVQSALRGTPEEKLPLLASAAAHTAGGRGGPQHYLHIPKGQVLRRHIAGLDPYVNQVLGLRITGRMLLRWLEHAARIFTTLQPDTPEQNIIDIDVPGFHFDTIFGLTYRIDPTLPPQAREGRIRALSWQGNPVLPDQRFIIATNQFRAAGGGGFQPTDPADIVLRKPANLQDALVRELSEIDPPLWEAVPPWCFEPDLDVHAMLHTSPDACDHLSDIAHLRPEISGMTPDGFARLRLTL